MSAAPVLANPAKMIAKGAPRIIHNDKELEAYTDALFKLTALENPTPTKRKPSNSSPCWWDVMKRSVTPSLRPVQSPWCGI
jgi:hypothetical protein